MYIYIYDLHRSASPGRRPAAAGIILIVVVIVGVP